MEGIRRSGQSSVEDRTQLAERLRERKAEIEEAVLARSRAIADPSGVKDPTYALSLREAIATALDYGIEAIESSERNPPEIPLPLLAQARLAARAKVPLDTVLRRYFAGYTLLGDFVLEEAERCGVGAGELKGRMRAQGAFLERLLGAVAQEYERERERPRSSSTKRRQAKSVERLLAGEPADRSELHYDLSGWHLGAVVTGPGATQMLCSALRDVDALTLIVEREDDIVWLWLGSRAKESSDILLSAYCDGWESPVAVSVGEPAQGPEGWRITHRQALAALPVALRSQSGHARYREVAILASALQDDLLTTSLDRLYLEPLECERDKGMTARETLRAYIDSRCTVSSAASVLGITRKTVTARLRTIEGLIGRSLDSCWTDVDSALRLYEARHQRPTHSV